MEGYVSTFKSNESECLEYSYENECELPASNNNNLNTQGKELAAERFSNYPSMDSDLNNVVVGYEKGIMEGCEMIMIVGEIYNQYRDLNVEEYKLIFEKEERQNKLIEQAAEKAAEIKSKRVKQLIQYCGDSKRKEIIREMNKMIKAHKDNPDTLEGAWRELVQIFAPGQFF